MAKTAFWSLDSPKLISRKIWVTEKILKFPICEHVTQFEAQTFFWHCTSWIRMSPFGGIKERSNKMVPIPLKNFFACSVLLCSSYLLWTIDLAFFRTPHPLGVGPIFPRQCCNAMYVHATQVFFFLRRLVWWVTALEGLPRVKILFKRKNIELSIDPFSPWSTRKLI